MSDTGYFLMLSMSLALGLLAFIAMHSHRRARRDAFREDLFTMRDGLFDYMWLHGIPFSSPAYLQLRGLLNGAIRLTDDITLGGLVAAMVFESGGDEDEVDELRAAIDAIPDPADKEHFQGVYAQVETRALKYIFFEGIPGPFFRVIRLGAIRLAEEAERELRRRVEVELAEEFLRHGKPGGFAPAHAA